MSNGLKSFQNLYDYLCTRYGLDNEWVNHTENSIDPPGLIFKLKLSSKIKQ